jgi:hypothetical protein
VGGLLGRLGCVPFVKYYAFDNYPYQKTTVLLDFTMRKSTYFMRYLCHTSLKNTPERFLVAKKCPPGAVSLLVPQAGVVFDDTMT